MIDDKTKARFFNKVKKHKSGCWDWQSGTVGIGHGQFWFNGKAVLAHRFSYQAFVVPFNQHIQVMHKCDNPGCVNPKHLFLGSQKDNMQDCSKKGRIQRQSKRMKACSRGHAFTKANTKIYYRNGYKCRRCLTCRSVWEYKNRSRLNANRRRA